MVATPMKGILCAGLLAVIQTLTAAQAYEADIHYSTTYVLARAVGWPEADALVIASANQGVDENHDTVASLEVEAMPGARLAGYVMRSFRQSDKNLRFHCFSRTREEGARISEDVHQVISRHFADVPAPRTDAQSKVRRLIALGVALHCQQDAHSHVGYGGSCGSHAGNCHGHAYQTLLDQVAFRVMKKHYFNPDHPGVSGQRLLETLQGTVRELAARRPRSASRSIPTRDLVALSEALRGSGIDLPDEERRGCNRHLAGKWLHDFLQSTHDMPGPRESETRLSPAVAAACRNASLASARIVTIPDPHLPRLNADASPHLVRADGTYQRVREGAFASVLPRVHAHANGAALPNNDAREIRLQFSHWSQLLALTQAGPKVR
jgi:hypothetical protein